MADLVIGLDCSTTACKAVVWDLSGNPIASGRAELPLLKPKPLWHEQPAGSWWQAAVEALRQAAGKVNPNRLAALCIAPQRETFVITDADGIPRHDALVWMDERCRSLLPELDRLYGQDRIHAESGKPLSANLTLAKLFWLSRNQPELCSPDLRVCDVHAFLTKQLTGEFVTSWGCADPTGLFDMRQQKWNHELIEAVGFHENQFPAALAPGAVIGRILPGAAQLCGLPENILLAAGLGDGQAAGLGVNVTQPGDAYLNLGTAVVSGTISQDYIFDRAFRTMFAATGGEYLLETVLLGGTYTINWFFEKFAAAPGTASQAAVELEAAQLPPGSEGLILVPYWNSAMNPYWDASASGVIIGWHGFHGLPHVYRAILEGIAFEQRLHTQGVEAALGRKIDTFIAVGGGARSPLWRQIIADVTQKRVAWLDIPEATALGAGILAAGASGLYNNHSDAANAMSRRSNEAVFPDPDRALNYDKLFDRVYRNLYPALRPFMSDLADLSYETSPHHSIDD